MLPRTPKPAPVLSPRQNPASILLFLALWLLCSSCARDREHILRVSVPDQQMVLYKKDVELARYPVSTSKFGLGDIPGSNCTPLGRFEIARKIGAHQPLGMKFKDRKPTGEIVPINAPGRDPIVTRILWLRGLESKNRNAFERMIYIHGTPEESKLGAPASYGCVRMRSSDVCDLFHTIGVGARVFIQTTPLPSPLPTTLADRHTPPAIPKSALSSAPSSKRNETQ